MIIFGLSGVAILAITAVVLTAVVQICKIVRQDKAWQAKKRNKK